MVHVPQEPEAFTELIAKRFHQELRTADVQVSGSLELLIDGHRVDLDDLQRAVRGEEADANELIQRFIDAFVSTQRLIETPLPFEVVQPKILPQIRPLERLRGMRPGFMASQPFINDTVILYMIDMKDAATPLSTEQLIKWGVDVDEIDRIARNNLASYQPELELQLFRSDDASAALFNTGDGYDASRLLLDQLYPKLAPELGGNFLVAIPTRDVFIAFPMEPKPFVDRLKTRIRDDFKSLPYPITSDLFLVTLDGVAEWREAA